jgi:peptide/nickel transport system substrate-binding protein
MSERQYASKRRYAPMVANGTFGGSMSADAGPADIVSTGPWMFGSYSRGERVILKRNPYYWRKDAAGQSLPYLDELVMLLARNFDTQFLQFQNGELDHYHCYRGGKDVAALRPVQEKDNFTLHQLGPEVGDAFLTLNMNLDAAAKGKIPEYKVKWFRDTRFRQAISYAIDRAAIVRNIYRNLAYPQFATDSVGLGPFDTPVAPIRQDIPKAKALLAEMGLMDRDGDGIIEDGQGHKVQFTIVTNSGNTARVDMCVYLATDLSKLGMEVNSLPMEFNLIIDKLDVSHDWEAIVISFTSMWDPHWGSNFWKSDSTNHLWWPEQKKPSFDWEKRLDDIFEQGIQELDPVKRKKIYEEVTRISYDVQPVIFLAVRERIDAVRNRFGNLFPSPFPLWELATMHNEEEMFLLSNAGKAPKPPQPVATAGAGR